MSKYFIILFCLAAILCSAQTVKPKAVARKPAIARKTTFAIISRPYQDSISLRWVLGDYNSWLLSKRFGYDIYRASISTDTSDFIKLNEEPILPVSEDEFNQKYLKDPIASKAAFSCIHSGDTPDKNLKEAIGKSDARSMTFAMAILAANIYPKVAKISGMMYVDKNIQKGKKYLYKIVLSPKANFKLAATTTVTTGDAYEIPQIAGFVGKSLGKSAQLKWQKSYIKREFAYYNIYRSETNLGVYEKINELPYVQLDDNNNNPLYANYLTQLPTVDRSYFFKVKGYNTFGDSSEFTTPIELRARISLLIAPEITRIFSSDNKNVQLTWAFEDKTSLKNLQGFFVERSNEPVKGPRRLLNKKPLKMQTFLDSKPLTFGYYRVLAVGITGDTTYSSMKLMQLVDSTAPGIPQILESKVDTNKIITLRWKANKEEDLLGYRVFYSYSKKGTFIRLTGGTITDTVFRDTISKTLGYKQVYYKVGALDFHENMSKKTPFITVRFIDNKAPEAPTFIDTYQEVGKLGLKWQPSGSSDVVKTLLLRKEKYQYDWQTIFTMDSATSYSIRSFVDTTVVPGKEYVYALQSTDWVGLLSASETIDIKALKPFYMPEVENFRALPAPANRFIKLAWDYKQTDLKSFAIYRKENSQGKLVHLITLAATEREYYDRSLQPTTVYSYYIEAYFLDFSKSKMVGPLEVKY